MAVIRMIEAVRRGADDDVRAVRWGFVDTLANAWLPNSPSEAEVVEVVDAVMAGDTVWTRLATGAPGPKVRTVLVKVGHVVETIDVEPQPLYSIADIASF